MKDIFKFTFKNIKLKLKMFLYFLLLMVIEVVCLIVPLIMMASYNSFISFLGFLLLFVAIIGLSILAYKVIINKWVNYHYPHIKVDSKEIVLKLLALLSIFYPILIGVYLIVVLGGLLLILLNSWILWLVGFVILVIIIFQVGAINLAVIYIILQQIESGQKGYKCVFKRLIQKIQDSRKYCVQILVRITVYVVAILCLIGIIGTVGYFGLIALTIAMGSFGLLVGGMILGYLVGMLMYILLFINVYDFIIIRYANVKKLILQ